MRMGTWHWYKEIKGREPTNNGKGTVTVQFLV